MCEQAEAAFQAALGTVAQETKSEGEALRQQAEAAEKLQPLRDEEAARAAVLHRLSVERDALEREEARAKARQAELETRLAQASRDLAREEEHIAEAENMLRGLGEEARRLEAASSRDVQEPQLREAAARAASALAAAERRSARRPSRTWRGRAPSDAASMPKQPSSRQRIGAADAPIRRHRRGACQARSRKRRRRQSPGPQHRAHQAFGLVEALEAELTPPNPPKIARGWRSRMRARGRCERQASSAGATRPSLPRCSSCSSRPRRARGLPSSTISASAAATSRRLARPLATISMPPPTRPHPRIGG